jgi:hypothetical protein
VAGVPGVLISHVLSGAADRLHEWQVRDFADAQQRRNEILKYYGDTMDRMSQDPAYDAQREAITQEIGKVSAMPAEKIGKYTPKSEFSVPPHLQEPAATPPPVDLSHVVRAVTSGQFPGAPGAGGQSAQDGGAPAAQGAGDASAAGPSATPPPMPDVPQSAGEPPDSIGAIAPGGPPVVPPDVAPQLTSQAVPPGGIPLPTNRSAPEPSPMTGMPVGAPAAGAGGPAATPPPVSAVAPQATPPSAVLRGAFPGSNEIERQKLMMEQQVQMEHIARMKAMGLTGQGKPLIDPIKALAQGMVPDDDPDNPIGWRPATEDEQTPMVKAAIAKARALSTVADARKSALEADAALKSARARGYPVEIAIRESQARAANVRADAAMRSASAAEVSAGARARTADFYIGSGGGATPPNLDGTSPPGAGAEDANIHRTVSGYPYVDATGYSAKMRDALKMRYERRGVTVLTDREASVARDIDTARLNQDSIFNSIAEKLPKDSSGRLLVGPENKLSQFFQTDEDLASFNSWRAAAIQSLRAIAGGAGSGFRINQAEIAMAMENDIPRITDTVGVATAKKAKIEAMLDNAERPKFVRNRAGMGGSTGAPGAPQATPPALGGVGTADTSEQLSSPKVNAAGHKIGFSAQQRRWVDWNTHQPVQ